MSWARARPLGGRENARRARDERRGGARGARRAHLGVVAVPRRGRRRRGPRLRARLVGRADLEHAAEVGHELHRVDAVALGDLGAREPGEPGAREPDAREELGVLVRVHAPDRALADAEREDARVAREVEAVRVVLAVHAQLAVRDRPEHGVARVGQVDRGLEHVVDRVVARAERRLQRHGGGGRAGGGSVRKARSRPDALLLQCGAVVEKA